MALMVKTRMNRLLFRLRANLQDLVSREEGQDPVEYALVAALVAFCAAVGILSLNGAIGKALGNISSNLGISIT